MSDLMHSAGKRITVQYVNVQYKKGSQDCGLFAIAFACEICFGKDPSVVSNARILSHHSRRNKTLRASQIQLVPLTIR